MTGTWPQASYKQTLDACPARGLLWAERLWLAQAGQLCLILCHPPTPGSELLEPRGLDFGEAQY